MLQIKIGRLLLLVHFRSTKMRSTIIRNNRNFLKEVIRPDEITFQLESCGCLTEDQVTFLTRLRNHKEKNHELLVMLQDLSSQKYSKTIDCLFLANQVPAALVLERGGETMKVRVHNIPDARTKLFETEFNERFQQLQRGKAFILNDLINVYAENALNEVFVFHAKRNKGVELWFWCKTKNSLNQLKTLNDGALREIIHRVYRRLIPEHYALLKPQIIQKNKAFASYFAERRLSTIRQIGNIAVSPMIGNSQWITSLTDKIYVIQHREIWVYDSKNPYRHLKCIQLNPSEMSGTISIASCSINKCLYISDPANAYIVKMEPEFGNRMSKWFNEGGDYKISTTRKGDILLFESDVNYPTLRIISHAGTVKRTIPVDSHFSQTRCIQEITPDLVALSYQTHTLNVALVSFIAIMCLDENGGIIRYFELQRENVCLASFRYGDLLVGRSGRHVSGYSIDFLIRSYGSHSDLLLRNKDGMVHQWLIESKVTQDILTTYRPKTYRHNKYNEDIHCIHVASDLRQLFVSSIDGLEIYQLKHKDEEDD